MRIWTSLYVLHRSYQTRMYPVSDECSLLMPCLRKEIPLFTDLAIPHASTCPGVKSIRAETASYIHRPSPWHLVTNTKLLFKMIPFTNHKHFFLSVSRGEHQYPLLTKSWLAVLISNSIVWDCVISDGNTPLLPENISATSSVFTQNALFLGFYFKRQNVRAFKNIGQLSVRKNNEIRSPLFDWLGFFPNIILSSTWKISESF